MADFKSSQKATSIENPFWIPNPLPGGISTGYISPTDYNTASYYVDPAVEALSLSGAIPMSRIAPGGDYRFGNGSVTAPSISFAADSDTGFYKSANSLLDVTVDGVRVAYFNVSGIVIPSITPGSVLFAGSLYSGQIAQDNAKLFWDDTNFGLGIGTASPASNGLTIFGVNNTLRLSYSVPLYCGLSVDGNAYLSFTSVGGSYQFAANTASTAIPTLDLTQSGVADSSLRWNLNGGTSFAAGIDNSDSDSWKLSYNTAANAVLGTNDYITVTTAGVTTISSLALSGFTAGSVLFAGASSVISQNNASFFWDNTNYRLKFDSPTHAAGINFSTTAGLMAINTAIAVFAGTNDDVLYIGYNQGRAVATEPSFLQSLESNYNNGVANLLEVNWDYVSSDGLTTKRPLSLNINRATHVGNFTFSDIDVLLLQNSSVAFAKFDKTNQLLNLYNAAGTPTITFDTTATPMFTVNTIRMFNISTNLFLGASAGNTTLTGLVNVGIGANAFAAATSATDCTAVGNNSLDAITSGNNNTAVGSGALGGISTAAGCTAVGQNALLTTNAANNCAFGIAAAQKTTTGASNCAFGANALFNNLTGSNNAAFGHQALNASTGDGNAAFGYQAGLAITSGTGNSAFGFQAMITNQTAAENSAFGNSALTLATGQKNTAVGFATLDAVGTGSENTGIGDRTGRTVTTGTKNTFLGATANASANNRTNGTALGYASSVDADNCIVMGDGNVTLIKAGGDNVADLGSTSKRYKTGHFGTSLQVDGANGQNISFGFVTELTTVAAAATTDTAIQIPANAIVHAVSARNTVAIPTAATYTITGTTSGTQFDVAGGVAVAVNTTDVGTRNCPYKNGAAQTIRITPDLVPANNNGRVRITIHYYIVTAPTS